MSIKKISIIIGVALLATGASVAIGATVGKTKPFEQVKNEKKQQLTTETRLPIEIAGGATLSQLSDASGSWAGELVSPTILEMHPEGEGSIVQLAVRVGQKVSQGDLIAKLSSPPASVERANVAAEKKEALINARAKAETMAVVVKKSREQFLEAKKSLIPARDSALALAQKDIDRNLFVNNSSEIELEKTRKEKDAAVLLAIKERDKARVDAGLKDRELRLILEQAIEKDLSTISTWSGLNVRQLLRQWSLQLKSGVGGTDSSVKGAYEIALGNALRALESSLPLEDAALAYADSVKRLMYATSGGGLSSAMIEMWKEDARESEMDLLAAVKEKKESENMAEVKDAELVKMIADRDKETTASAINVRKSKIDSESNEIAKGKSKVDGELEYQGRKREIDIRLAELDRELEMARKEVIAAEESYATFLGELSSQMVRAQRSGIISGIFKNTGDYVTPENIIVSISQEKEDDAFVRFRIPSDSAVPDIGSEVMVIRPGFPFDRRTAIVSGVGGAVGSQGVFSAEAELVDSIDWPIHALVRVMPSKQLATVYVPFTALLWEEGGETRIVVVDEQGMAKKRAVKTGKAVGDTVEIREGLSAGEKYISRKLVSDVLEKILKEGVKSVQGMILEEPEQSKGESDLGGHGHE